MNSSDLGALFNIGRFKSKSKLYKEKIGETKEEVVSKEKQAIFDHGHQTEAKVFNYLKESYPDFEFSNPVIWYKNDLLAASPDGLISKNDIPLFSIEIKSPVSTQSFNKIVTYEKEAGWYTYPVIIGEYYLQVQAQLYCSGLKKCIFCLYHDGSIRIILVEENKKIQKIIIKEIEEFYHLCIKPRNPPPRAKPTEKKKFIHLLNKVQITNILLKSSDNVYFE